MAEALHTPIAYLKGIGPEKAALLKKELNVETYWDLLNHFPFRYIDRSKISTCRSIPETEGYIQLEGFIDTIQELGARRAKRLQCRFSDDTGSIQLIWFQGWRWIKPNLIPGKKFRIFGRPKLNGAFWSIPHPEISPATEGTEVGFQPIYSSTEKLSAKGFHSRGLEKLIRSLIQKIDLSQLPDLLPAELRQKHRLFPISDALTLLHVPKTERDFVEAKRRLVFEELFLMQMEMLLRKGLRKRSEQGYLFTKTGKNLADLYHQKLPFDLTEAQKRVVREIHQDMKSGEPMNRLLQGDVGSGKTLVALITMLLAQGNGFQATLLAPTEILANQHFETISSLLKDLPVRAALLTGSVKRSVRTPLLADLKESSIDFLIGTHALLEDEVKFAKLGLVVIDEQHRFGVAQRAKMRQKSDLSPHVLVMTATPIPRTLAMTFYGDLDVSIIDELPPGRKPIQTIHRFESHRPQLYQFMREQIGLGRQIYIVYPLIEESETLDFKSLEDGYLNITEAFPIPEYHVSMVHGKMRPEDKDREMQRFIEGTTHIMVATTVIEVGVNVPNASVMIIESAQRFGLSQLHQLRGRVGRGAEKSYCVLMTDYELSKESKKRMDTMVETNDGFKISEVDLKLRGPGDLMGTQQSGALNLKIADLSKDQEMVVQAREEAIAIYSEDPRLAHPSRSQLRNRMIEVFKHKPHWDKIG
ncbi:MAG: ATP-dependent DNA helicase RecG [Bacteroidota bacterium]